MTEEEEFEFRARLEAEQAAPSSSARPVTWGEAGRQVGRTARMGIEGVTGLPMLVGDAANELINMGTRPFGVKPLQKPSAMLSRLLDQLGLPKPEGTLEKIVDFGGQVMAGTGDPVSRGVQKYAQALAPKGFQPPKQTTAYQDTAKELHDAGVKLKPTQLGGGKTSRAVEGFSGSPHMDVMLRHKNQPTWQAMAAKATKQDPKNLTEAALDAATKQVVNEAYQPVKDMKVIRMGGAYKRELLKIADEFKGVDKADRIVKRVEDNFVNKLDADAVLDRIRHLRSDASDAFRNNERTYGQALRKLADAIEDQVERNLPKGSKVLDDYRAGRMQIAKNDAVKNMLVDKTTGIVDPSKAHQLLENGVPLTDELLTIAKAGSPMFEHVTKAPIKGEGVPFSWGDYLPGAGAGLLGFAAGGLPGVLAAAIPPVARGAGRQILASRPIQNMMARNLAAPQPMSPFAQRIPPALLAPLFSQGEE